jgi:alginate O-acetyltransferase complex protein AlgI
MSSDKMRPFRSFLLLFLLLSCLTGLYYIIPHIISLPRITDFLPVVKQEAESEIKAGSVPPQAADTIQKNLTFSESVSRLFDSLHISGKQIRIMYYGDSQIEGDRISSYLRMALRKKYGGTGPGLFLPLMPVMYTKSIYVRSSSNWKRYNYLSIKNGEYKSSELGPFMTVCRFLPPGIHEKPEKAFVRVVPSQLADSDVSRYEKLRLLYRNPDGRVKINVTGDGKAFLTDTLRRTSEITELSCNLGMASDIRIEFEGKVSPDIGGISIESENGVVVDNIPQRGSAGLEFTMVDSADLHSVYRILAPDLIILQYGLNIVRNVRKEYGFYEAGYYRQLERLKDITNGAAILVVSVTDMASSVGDSIRSFPNIPAISGAQQKAAEKAGVGFWDSRAAMGGEFSIVKWSRLKFPLAQADLVHFTNSGADTLSYLLVRELFTPTDTTGKNIAAIIPAGDTSIKNLPVNNDTIFSKDTAGERTPPAIMKHIFTYDPANSFIFTTTGFWIFLLIVFAGYSIVYRKIKLRNIYLLIVSLYFYFKTGGLFLFLLIFVTVVDYSCGILIHRSEKKFSRKFFIVLSLVSNLGLLAYFKYAAFLINGLNSLLGTHFMVFDLLSSVSNSFLGTAFDTSFIILPVGISFFTFQSLSYTIDVYRKRMEPVRNLTDFGFYVSFFPHLVAGPIVRASVFMPQVYQEFSLSKREFSHALFMISRGLIKKIIISNFIAVSLVDRVFDAPALYSGFENLMAIYGYGLQIYCDFSGYTDIAIGVALIFGFRLPLNFNSPYKASSITDFWKRWHISLSQWLKDYLYISLGGNRKGKIRTYINLMITMLIGGLWHGAALRFVLWGGLHGAALVADRIRSSIFSGTERFRVIGRLLGIFITFNFVNFCWIFFRAESMNDCLIMLRQIGTNFSPGSYFTVMPAYGQVFLLILTGYLVHFLPEKIKESYRGFFIRTPLIGQLTFMFLLAVVLWQMRSTGVMPFIYFRF